MQWKHSFLNYLLISGLLLTGGIFAFSFNKGAYDLTLVISCSVFVVAFILSLLLYNRKTLKSEERYQLSFDGEMLSCRHPEKPDETLRWKDISGVTIITTDKGPYEPYLWISLNDDKGEVCMFPLGARNSRDLLEKIMGFEGLDLELWAKAIRSTENKKFIVWRRSANN